MRQTSRRTPNEPRLQDRYRGCLLGGAVGDALGAPVEFMRRAEIVARFGEPGIRDYVPAYGRTGAITDDTQMTLFTAEGMLRAWVRACMRGIGPAFVPVTERAYLRWLQTQDERPPARPDRHEPPGWLIGHAELFSQRGPGMTCLAALRARPASGWEAANDSKGCGGVMRVAPVGMFMARSGRDAADAAREAFKTGVQVAGLTHGHPTGQLAAGVLAAVVALVLRDRPLDAALDAAMALLCKQPAHEETAAAIQQARTLAAGRPGDPETLAQLGQGWVAEEALAIGLYCALGAADFESALVLSVNHDGDSDSTGSITGNLLGALHGASAIPPRWLAALELRGVIEEVADDLATWPEWQVGEQVAAEHAQESRYWWERYPGC